MSRYAVPPVRRLTPSLRRSEGAQATHLPGHPRKRVWNGRKPGNASVPGALGDEHLRALLAQRSWTLDQLIGIAFEARRLLVELDAVRAAQ